MFLMGFSTMAVGLLPTYQQVGMLAPVLLVVLRLIQGFAVAGEISGASSMILEHAPFGRRGFYASFTLQGVQAGQILAAAVFLPLAHYMPEEAFNSWGWRIPFLLSFVVIIAGYIIRREVDETPAFAEEGEHGEVPKSPIVEAFRLSWTDMMRVVCMALMNVIPVVTTIFGAAYAVQPAYGIGFHKDIYLWIPVLGNILAVFVIPVRRQPVGQDRPQAADHRRRARARGCSRSATSTPSASTTCRWRSSCRCSCGASSTRATTPFSRASTPSFSRRAPGCSAMAISQNVGTTITALLPALFATVAPPGSANIPLTIGAITFAVTVIAAVAAMTARETYRIHLNDLGEPDAVPVDKAGIRPAAGADPCRLIVRSRRPRRRNTVESLIPNAAASPASRAPPRLPSRAGSRPRQDASAAYRRHSRKFPDSSLILRIGGGSPVSPVVLCVELI